MTTHNQDNIVNLPVAQQTGENDICNDCLEARHLNARVAKFIDMTHELAKQMPNSHGLSGTLTMVNNLRKELIQMKGGKKPSESKPWQQFRDKEQTLNEDNIAEAACDSMADAMNAIRNEEGYYEQRDMVVTYIRSVTFHMLDLAHEVFRADCGSDIIGDAVTDWQEFEASEEGVNTQEVSPSKIN